MLASQFALFRSHRTVRLSTLLRSYCATKAALHSLTMTLRCWLSAKGIKVIELAPPLVESQLHDDQGTTEKLSKVWMPIKDFTAEVMEGFKCVLITTRSSFALINLLQSRTRRNRLRFRKRRVHCARGRQTQQDSIGLKEQSKTKGSRVDIGKHLDLESIVTSSATSDRYSMLSRLYFCRNVAIILKEFNGYLE